MPPLDLRRVDAAARRAVDHLGRRTMPAPYPPDPAALERAATDSRRAYAVVVNTCDGALELLRQAVKAERAARAAQEAAVEALRFCGGAAPSWEAIGRELGISGQAAHRRYSHLERPTAQRSIDGLEDAA